MPSSKQGKFLRTWNQTRLRLTIASLWIGFWIVSSIIVIMAPYLRADGAIESTQVLPLLIQIASVWLPCLTCLVAFWFTNQNEKKSSTGGRVSGEKALTSVVLTSVYLLFVLIVILFPLYWVSYPTDTIELPQGASLTERMSDSVKYALLLSPLALAPINWLTGTDFIKNQSTSDVRKRIERPN
jgi:hypothetical protein